MRARVAGAPGMGKPVSASKAVASSQRRRTKPVSYTHLMLLSAVHTEHGEEKLHLVMVDDAIPAGAKLC